MFYVVLSTFLPPSDCLEFHWDSSSFGKADRPPSTPTASSNHFKRNLEGYVPFTFSGSFVLV
jgi:hypothetical protein